MGIQDILASVDHEIALLKQARALLSDDSAAPVKRVGRRGRKAATIISGIQPANKAAKKKRNLSPEGRRRIAEAVKRRWALERKAATSK